MEITDKDRDKYYNDLGHLYPRCKLKIYRDNKKLGVIPYHSIKSKKQINSLLNIKKGKIFISVFHRLFSLLGKFINIDSYMQLLSLLTKEKDDYIIYTKIKKMLKNYNKQNENKKEININKCDRDVIQAESVVAEIKNNINNLNKLDNYLDIGCGDCIKTFYIGKLLGLESKHIYGADIGQWYGYSNKTREHDSINFIKIEPNKALTIKDNTFSLVSAYMMLHHVENLELMITELYRIIKHDGYLIIIEHDAISNIDKMLCDIEHSLFAFMYENAKENFLQTYYATYYDKDEWNILFLKNGFKYIASNFIFDATVNITPTRTFYSIYQKIIK